MSFKPLNLRALFAWSVLAALSGFLVANAHAGPKQRSRSIEFSDPKSDEVTTNLNQLTSKKDSLQQLEEQTYKAFQSFSPKGSLDGEPGDQPIRPVNPPVVPNKRMKELLERRKDFIQNYYLMSPDDVAKGPTIEEMFQIHEYGPDGQEKKQPTVLERAYERLSAKKKPGGGRDEGANDAFAPQRRNGIRGSDDAELPGGLKDTQQALKRLFEEDSGAEEKLGEPAPARSVFSDPFGLGDPLASRERELMHKKEMDDYRSLLDPSWHPSSADAAPAGGSLEPARPAVTSSGGASSVFKQAARESSDAAAASIAPITAPLPPQDITTEVLSKYASTPAPLKPEPPKQTSLKPTFEFPRRPGL